MMRKSLLRDSLRDAVSVFICIAGIIAAILGVFLASMAAYDYIGFWVYVIDAFVLIWVCFSMAGNDEVQS